jgi:phage-related protein
MADNYVELLVRSQNQAKPDLADLKARLQELGHEVETARGDVDDADTAAKLDKLRAQLLELDHKTANPKISMSGALRAEAQIHLIEAAMRKLNDDSGKDGEEAGRSWGSRFSSAALSGLRDLGGHMGGSGELGDDAAKGGHDSGGFFASNFTKTVLGGLGGTLITGISSIMATLPALGAIGGVGLVAGLGAMVASKIPGVAAQFKALGTQVMGTLEQAVRPMLPFITGVVKQIGGFVQSIGPELSSMFKAVGPMLQPLVSGLEGLVKGVLPGLSAILKAAMPAVQAFAQVLAGLGKNLGGLFSALAPAVTAGASAMKSLFGALGPLLPMIGQVAGIFAKMLAPAMAQVSAAFRALGPVVRVVAEVVAEFAKAFLGNLAGGLKAIAGLVSAVAPAFTTLAKALGQVFNLMNNRGVFNDIEDAIEGLVGPLGKLISALVAGLVPVLPQLVGLLGEVASVFQAGLVSAVSSMVNAVTPLVPVLAQMAVAFTKIMSSGLQALAPLLVKLAPYILAIVGAVKLWSIAQAALDLVMSANPLILIGIAIVGLVGLVVELVKHWNDLANVAKTVFAAVKNAVATALDWIKEHWPLLLAILLGPIALAALEIKEHWTQISNGAKDLVHDVTSWFGKLPGLILHALGDLGHLLYNAGKAIIQGLIDGIGSMIGDVEHAASSVVDDIKSFLPFSPAKKGPMSGSGSPQRSGEQIAAMLAAGMDSGRGTVQAAAARMAANAGIGPGGRAPGYAGGYAPAAAAGPTQLEVLPGGGSAFEQFMVLAMRNYVRVRGGDVQKALGH